MARKIAVEIVGDASSLEKAFKRSEQSAARFNRNVSSASRRGGGLFGGLTKTLGLVTAGFGAAGLAGAVHASVQEFENAQQVSAQTEAAIKSTGQAAGVTAKHVNDLADAMLRKSGIDDEATKTAENMLLTFTNVRNEVGQGNQIFDRATNAVADLATRMNGGAIPSAENMQRSALQLGKALNDPIKGIGQLRRVGIQFTGAQQNQIKALVKSHQILEAQKIILGEVRKEFGGSAKAAGDTFAGSIAKVTETLRNMGGEIVQSLAPSIQKVADRFEKWMTNSENQKRVLDTVHQVVGAVTAVLGSLKNMLDGLNGITGSTKHSIELLVGAFVAFKTLKLVSTLGNIAANMTLIGTNAEKSAGKVGGLRNGLQLLVAGGPYIAAVAIALTIDQKTKKQRESLKDKLGPFGFLVSGPKDAFEEGVKAFEKSYDAWRKSLGLKPRFAGPAPPQGATPGRTPLDPRRFFPTPAAAAGDTTTGRRPVSLLGRFNLAELKLAQAQLTKTLADDRRILVVEKAITEQQIAHAKSLKDKISLTQQLVGINNQILSIDQQQADAIKQQNQALKDRADAIKAAILDRLQRQQTRREDKRAIEDAREQLRIAKLEGGPGGIRLARRDLTDALFQMRIFQLEAAQPKLRRLPGGQQQFGFGGVTVVINGVTDPDKVAAKVVEVLKRRQRRTSQQQRGVNQTAGGGGR